MDASWSSDEDMPAFNYKLEGEGEREEAKRVGPDLKSHTNANGLKSTQGTQLWTRSQALCCFPPGDPFVGAWPASPSRVA